MPVPPPNPPVDPLCPFAPGCPPTGGTTGGVDVTTGGTIGNQPTNCLPGLSRSPTCQPGCSGSDLNRVNICASTFCQLLGAGTEVGGRWVPCQAPLGYQPQYPPLGLPPPLPPGGPPVNPQYPPAADLCRPGEELECVDAFSGPGQEISPVSLPLLEDSHPYLPGQLSAALPQLVRVAVDGWDSLVQAISSGFSGLTQQLATQLTQATLPAEGGLLRSIDSVTASLAKIDTKLLNNAVKLIGEGVAYAAQLGIPAPTQDDFQALSAGVPLSQMSPTNTTPPVAGGCNYPTVETAAGYPELDFITDNYNTVCPPKYLGPSLGPCQVIKKDPLDGSGGRWYQTHQSQCIPPGGPHDEPTVPGGSGGDVGAGGDFGGGGVIQNVPADQACTVLGVPFHQVQNNADGTITIVDDQGRSITLDPNSPLISCAPAGGGGGQGGGGNLIVDVGGGSLVGGGGGGNIVVTPGGNIVVNPASCPPPIVNVPPCPTPAPGGGGGPAGQGQLINNAGGTIINNAAGPPANIVVTPSPVTPPNVIVNVPIPPDKELERSRVAGGNAADPLTPDSNWNSLKPCPYTATILSNYDIGRLGLANILGWGITPSGSAKAPGNFSFALSLLPLRIGETISGFIGGLIDSLQATVNDLIGNADCKPVDVAPTLLSDVILGFIDTFTGGSLHAFRTPYQQQINSACPQRVPSADECHAALLNGTINQEQWECWVRANGVADVPAKQIMQSQRSRPNVAEALQLWLRGEFNDSRIDEELQFRGVIDKDERAQFKKLTDYVPGPGDLVSMMLRDVFDPAVVDKYRLDEDFAAKFQGQIKTWAKAQGISDETMKLYWRFHWHMPSDGQLFEMLHRLRPGKEGVKNVTTIDDVKTALQINDLMPGWVDRLTEISYRPLGRIDVRRAYEVGVITADQLPSYYQDLGYAESDAKTLSAYTQKASAAAVAKFQGMMTTPQILTLYKQDGVSRDKAKELLKGNGLDDQGATSALDNADAQAYATLRAEQVRAVRKRYMQGEYTDSEATTKLQTIGLSFDRANQRVLAWGIEKELDHKLPSTQQLCSLYSDGFIDASTYLKRMQNLGWGDEDAANFVKQCASKDVAKRAKELEAQLRKQQQQQRQQDADEKRRQKDLADQRKRLLPCTPAKKPTCPPGVV